MTSPGAFVKPEIRYSPGNLKGRSDRVHLIKEQDATPPTVLAFDVGGTRIKAGIVRGGETLAFHSELLNRQESAADFVRTISRIGNRLREQYLIQAVGVSLKGIIDSQQGVVLEIKEVLTDLIGQPLAAQLHNLFMVPVVIENDARMYTLGELLYGAGRPAQNMLCLTLGTGIGCGVAINRRILRGTSGLAGILGGHLSVEADGPLCNCGNLGCLEAFIGTTAFIEEARRQITQQPQSQLANIPTLTPDTIFQTAAAGDELALKLIQRFTHYLSVGVVSLIHAYGPDLVVIGGGIMKASTQILPDVQRYVARHTWALLGQHVKVSEAALGDTAALLGVSALACDNETLLL
jgi:glucokinase